MKLPPFQLLVMDLEDNCLLNLNGLSGETRFAIACPQDFIPVDLRLHAAKDRVFLPGNTKSQQGMLCIASLDKAYLYALPLSLPPISQFALSPSGSTAYFTTPEGTLYQLDITAAHLAKWGQQEGAGCVGLTADTAYIYTIWEYHSRGFLAIFDCTGKLLCQQPLPAIPTNLQLTPSGQLVIAVTSSDPIGEGLLVWDSFSRGNTSTDTFTYFMYNQELCRDFAYPCHMSLAPEEHLLYLVNESIPAIFLLDLKERLLVQRIALPFSITCLYLLPEGAFAIASSLGTSRLALIDLLSGQPVYTTDTQRKLLPYMGVLPCPF